MLGKYAVGAPIIGQKVEEECDKNLMKFTFTKTFNGYYFNLAITMIYIESELSFILRYFKPCMNSSWIKVCVGIYNCFFLARYN